MASLKSALAAGIGDAYVIVLVLSLAGLAAIDALLLTTHFKPALDAPALV